MSEARRALVAGASGFVGSHLVERLAADGWQVRAFVRYTSDGRTGWLTRMAPDLATRVEILSGGVRDEQPIDAATAGVDVVFQRRAEFLPQLS